MLCQDYQVGNLSTLMKSMLPAAVQLTKMFSSDCDRAQKSAIDISSSICGCLVNQKPACQKAQITKLALQTLATSPLESLLWPYVM